MISEGRCVSKSSSTVDTSPAVSGDAPPKMAASEASCNGSPTLRRQASGRATLGGPTPSRGGVADVEADELVYTFIACKMPVKSKAETPEILNCKNGKKRKPEVGNIQYESSKNAQYVSASPQQVATWSYSTHLLLGKTIITLVN